MLQPYKSGIRPLAEDKLLMIESKYGDSVGKIQQAKTIRELTKHLEYFKPVNPSWVSKFFFNAKPVTYEYPFESFVDVFRLKTHFHNEKVTNQLVSYFYDLDKEYVIRYVKTPDSNFTIQVLEKSDLHPYVEKYGYLGKSNQKDLEEFKYLLIREMIRNLK